MENNCPKCGSPERREIDVYKGKYTYVCTKCDNVWTVKEIL